MLSKDERNQRWELVSSSVHAPIGGDVRALREDHEAVIRGLRVLAIEKWQALAGGKGHSMPDEKWIEETIEAATRADVLDRLNLAEGAEFDLETELVGQERVAHDEGIGPDYAEAFRTARHYERGESDPGFPRIYAYLGDQLLDYCDVAGLGAMVMEIGHNYPQSTITWTIRDRELEATMPITRTAVDAMLVGPGR